MVNKTRKVIKLQVDDMEPTDGRITRKVDVIAPLYVGGLPKVYSAREGVVRPIIYQFSRIFFF